MTVFLQDGQLLFALEARNVPPSGPRAAYAVWFTGPGAKARRLGFTNPVGDDGRLGIQGPSEKDLEAFPQLYATLRARRGLRGDRRERQATRQGHPERQAAAGPLIAQRFGCHSAISPPAGAATTARQPAGPSRGCSATLPPSARARSTASPTSATST